jgi:hypothetical protein
MASEAEIKKRIAALKEEAEVNRQLYESDNRRIKALEKSQQAVEEILTLEQKLTSEYKDISKTLTDIGKKQRLNNISGKDTFGLQKNVHKELTAQLEDTQLLIKADKIKGSLADKLNDISGDIASGAYDLTGITQTQLELDEKIAEAKADENDVLAENLEGMKAVLDAEAKRLKVNKGIESSISTADGLLGGMGSTIKGFVTNPLTIAVAALMQFGATQEAIAGQFGAMGVTDFRNELVRSQAEFTRLGLSGEDALKATSDLANNFGIAFDEADELSGSVARIAKTTGMSVDESGKLVGLLVKTQGLTGQQAEDLLLSTRQLAKANNVAPDQVLKDVAANTELFAKFSSDGGKNILEAAVQARKLGLNLDSVAKVADGLLNFQESLNNEITASVMIGRQLNLQKARELALSNDVKGAMEEVVKQVGSEAEFNKLNALERKALADAVGLEASELQKVVSASKEQKTLAGQIKDATGKIEIPEETMTAIASLVASFKTVGILLAESIGPILNGILAPVSMIAGFLQSIGALGPTLIGIFTAIKVQSVLSAKAEALKAANITAGAFVGNPVKAAIGLGLAAAAIVKLNSMVRNVGDLSISKGRTMVSTAEGEMFRLSPNDDLIAAPGIAGAMAGGGGGAPQISAALENTINNLNQNIAAMRKDNESYFGFGGSVSADIGTKVESKIVSNLK